MLSDLCSHSGHKRPAGKHLMRFPETESIKSVHIFPTLGAVARSTPLVRLAGRCSPPQLISNRSRRTFQLPGYGSVGQSLSFQRLNGSAFFSLKMLPVLAFCRFYDIILAVHSDCPPLEEVVSKLHSTMWGNHYGFFLGVQLHFTIDLHFTITHFIIFARYNKAATRKKIHWRKF